MRTYTTFLIVAIVLLTSCKDDDGLPLTPDLVTSIKAFDLDNNGNSSDIRVDFNVRDNTNVFEYRVMVIPSNTSSSFTVDHASGIPESSYLDVNPESFKTSYFVNRLPSSFLDVNGNQIINETEYVAAVLIFGTGNHQLSGFSRPFTLKDQGIYNGRYFIGLKDECDPSLDRFADGTFYIDLISTADKYSGFAMCSTDFCINNNLETQGRAEFKVANFTVIDFTWNFMLLCLQGNGTIDELIIDINVVGCDGTCPGEWTLVRQY